MSTISRFTKIILVCLVMIVNSRAQADNGEIEYDNIFQLARYEGYREIIKLNDLLREGVDVDEVDENGLSPIHIAAKFNPDPKVIQVLQDHGANINQPSVYTGMQKKDRQFGGRPLFFALCYNPSVKVIELILNELKPEDRFTISQMVSLAARNPNVEVMAYLYQLQLNELLIESAVNTNTQIAKGFVELGANVNAMDRDSTTSPLVTAIKANNVRGVEYFLGEGALITVKTDGNKSVLISATSNDVDRNTSKIVNTLIMYGCNINEADSSGNTPLHLAVERATSKYEAKYLTYPLSVIEELLNLGADPKIHNRDGQTPSDIAKSHPTSNAGKPNLSDEVLKLIDQAEKDEEQRYSNMAACG